MAAIAVHGEVSTRGRAACRLTPLPRRQAARGRLPVARMETWPGTHGRSGGHAQALLDAHPGLMLIGLDTDAAAVEESGRLLAKYGDRVTVTRAVYDQVAAVLSSYGRRAADGFLFDLGVSSPQLD